MEQSPVYLLIPSLPDELTIDIVARVPISYYPTLSRVSKSFRNLIASPKLYEVRSLLGVKEHRVYAVLCNPNHDTAGDCSFYIFLHRELNSSNRFVHVRSLPPMADTGSYVPVGSKVYMLNNLNSLSIDCTSHKVQRISDIPQRMISNVANVIDGKVYLIGGYFCCVSDESELREEWKKVVPVFDTETETWERVMIKNEWNNTLWCYSVVMEGQIYLKGYSSGDSAVYEPKERKWELMNKVLNSKDWVGGCVVDDVLYYLDCSERALRAFDPKQSRWRDVNGLDTFLAEETAQSEWCKAVKYGEKKLALFFPKNHDGKELIYCAEIALERPQGGDIWGKRESCDVVVDDGMSEIVKFVSVTV